MRKLVGANGAEKPETDVQPTSAGWVLPVVVPVSGDEKLEQRAEKQWFSNRRGGLRYHLLRALRLLSYDPETGRVEAHDQIRNDS